MGRSGRPGQSRQARRAAARRHPEHRRGQAGKSINWPAYVVGGIILGAIAIFGIVFAVQKAGVGSATPTPNMTANPVDGIGCNNMNPGYHVHAHLSVWLRGKQFPFTPDAGHYYDHDCLFWVHKHNDEQGIIHIESPTAVKPTVKAFFDIVRKTQGASAVPNLTAGPGEQVKVWVNLKPYSGDPLAVPLLQHTQVDIEVGPPFRTPSKFPFSKYNI